MSPFQSILFPVDFSKAAIAMAPYVMEMALRFAAKVTVMHAVHLVPDYVMAPEFGGTAESIRRNIPYTPELQKIRDQHRVLLEDFASQHLPGVSYSARIGDGDPAAFIDWMAHNENMDLIMMPTRGRGKFRRLLLGSVTAKVLHDVGCPVFTSAHLSGQTEFPSDSYGSIVCAVERNAEAARVLNASALLTRTYGARLCVVHIDSSPLPHDEAKALQEVMGAEVAKLGVDGKVQVLSKDCATDVPDGIRKTEIEEKADLVIVGRGREQGSFSRIWSHLYEIVRESPCPVLSV